MPKEYDIKDVKVYFDGEELSYQEPLSIFQPLKLKEVSIECELSKECADNMMEALEVIYNSELGE